MVKLSDYVINYLVAKGIEYIFTVPGGGAMFLNDAVAKNNKIKPIFFHHEQAAAMAAVTYSKVTNKIGVLMVTTGCGGTNAITGVLDAWQDSSKLLIISGQVNYKETQYSKPNLLLRKLGAQEANILDIIEPITKQSLVVSGKDDIKYILDTSFFTIENQRPGPVWIDIPLDVQNSEFDESKLIDAYILPKEPNQDYNIGSLLKKSKRPIIIAGNGIRLAGAENEFLKFVEKYKIPVVCTFMGIDLIPTDHPQCIGRIGIKGTRAGNFAVQNADLVLSLGSSLSIPSTGYRYDTFAREAKIVVVDIDPEEHRKNTVKINKFIESDVLYFLKNNMKIKYECPEEWNLKCTHWKNKWPIFNNEWPNNLKWNFYNFIQSLYKILSRWETTYITDAGLNYYAFSQALPIYEKQRYIIPGAQAEMGYTLPACVGAYYANPHAFIVGITGDGSFQFNIQELQTIKHNNIPAKIFVINNGGYLSIKNTQDKFFDGRYFGVNKESGISFPSIEKIANAYGIDYVQIYTEHDLKEYWNKIIGRNKSCIFEVMLPQDEVILPTTAVKQDENGKLVSQPLENMFPFLDEEEFKQEMIVKPI